MFQSFFKTLLADVRTAFVAILVSGIVLILAPVGAAAWKVYSSEYIPWTIFIVVVCVGIILVVVAIRMTDRFPVLTEEKQRELQERTQKALLREEAPPGPEWSSYVEPREKKIRECLRKTEELLGAQGYDAESWPLKAIALAGAREFDDNDAIIDLCDRLVRHGLGHPFELLEDHIPPRDWLEFVQLMPDARAGILYLAERWGKTKGYRDIEQAIPIQLKMRLNAF